MATTSFAAGSNFAVTLWEAVLAHQILEESFAFLWAGTELDNLVVIKDELERGPGETIYYGFRPLITANPFVGNSTLEGNEASFTPYRDNVTIQQVRQAAALYDGIDTQRVPFNVREESRLALVEYFHNLFERSFLNQICDNRNSPAAGYDGNNTITVSDTGTTGHIHWFDDSGTSWTAITTDETLASDDSFQMAHPQKCVELAGTLDPPMRPLNINTPWGKVNWVYFIHPYQARAMRRETTTGEWLDLHRQGLAGSEFETSLLWTNSVGKYQDVLFVQSNWVPTGYDVAAANEEADVRRATFCGGQAAVAAFGKRLSPQNRIAWRERYGDYGNIFGVAAITFFGMKKVMFNSANWGVIVTPSYAAAF